MSDTYSHGHHESVLRSHKWRTAETSAASLLLPLRAGQDFLDVGCGPGTITRDLAARAAPGQVLGIDASAAVVEETRRNAPQSERVRFAVGDGCFAVLHGEILARDRAVRSTSAMNDFGSPA